MSGNDWCNKYVFCLWQKSVREADDWISWSKLFQRMDVASGNEHRQSVVRRYTGNCSRQCDEDDHRRWRPGTCHLRTVKVGSIHNRSSKILSVQPMHQQNCNLLVYWLHTCMGPRDWASSVVNGMCSADDRLKETGQKLLTWTLRLGTNTHTHTRTHTHTTA